MKKRIRILLFILPAMILATMANLACAQKTMVVRPITEPTITVNNLASNEKPVRISEVKTDVKIVGTMAVTTVEMVFHNPNYRVLEGELQFPLQDGQSISRFALDINGKLREGVVVGKAKGQEAFESVIRQRIDPGLLERTQGNNFRTRVYPLPSNGTRRIVIAYEQELKKEANGYRFHLPVEFGNKLDRFDVNLIVHNSFQKPEVSETPWGSFAFSKSGDAYVASYNAADYEAKGQIVFMIPNNNSQKVFVEEGKISNDHYFYASILPQFKDANEAKSKPKSIAIYWDNSASMQNRDFEKETQFLDKYFDELGSVRVFLYTFNVKMSKPQTFEITNGEWNGLMKALSMTPYDGATQLGALNFKYGADDATLAPPADSNKVTKRLKSMYEPDEIFVFSDGLSNFANDEPVLSNIPVNSVTSLQKSDHTILKYMSLVSGGKYIDLVQQSPAEAAKYMTNVTPRFLSATYNANEISDVTPNKAQIISPSSVFSISGKLLASSATITLHFGMGTEITHSETIKIEKTDALDYGNIVERMWAQKTIAELDLRYEKNKEQIEALGKSFTIVTRNTSLIVLDRVEDYVRYEIVPPVELQVQYFSIIGQRGKTIQNQRSSQIESVVLMFDQYKEWWQRIFPKNCLPQPKPSAKYTPPIISSDLISIDESPRGEMDMRSTLDLSESKMSITIADVKEDVASDGIEIMDLQSHKIVVEESDVAKRKPAEAPRPNMPTAPQQQARAAKIELKNWDPTTPYMKILKAKTDADLYRMYLDIKEGYKTMPAFYLDVATLFEERGLKEEALVILSNLAELEIENYRLMRIMGHRLTHLGYSEYAIKTFLKVQVLRPNEPQSYRDLALAYDSNEQFQEAVSNFLKVIEEPWDGRFFGVQTIATEEMNRTIERAKTRNATLDLSKVDERLIKNMPVDIRIVMNWDTDNSDMDLWVTDPCGEDCGYDNKLTRTGGTISNDLTGGYGPEVFKIKRAVSGTYKIKTNYYGSREQTLIGATTVYLEIYINYGTKDEVKQNLIVRLDKGDGMIDIGKVVFTKK